MSDAYTRLDIPNPKDSSPEELEKFMEHINDAIEELVRKRIEARNLLRGQLLTKIVRLVGSTPGLGSKEIVAELGEALSNPEIFDLLQEAEMLDYIYRYKLSPTHDNPQGRTVWYSR